MAPSNGTVLVHHLVVLILSLFLSFISPVYAGQGFTQGITIIDAPSVGNPGHAGSNIPIALEISGNGQLQPNDVTNVNSSSSIHYTSLEIYLVSAITGLNFTVSSGSDILTKEPGSTVLHLDWPIPTCITAGDYNLTFYEGSMVNGESHFTITPISIPIDNPNGPSGDCDSSIVNELQAQPQESNPPSQPLFSEGGSRMTTSFTGAGFTLPTLVTITLSGTGGIPLPVLPTVTVTGSTTPTTVVVVSMTTYATTETQQGQTTTETVTEAAWTSTVAVQNDNSGFIPVNSASATGILSVLLSMPLTIGLWLLI